MDTTKENPEVDEYTARMDRMVNGLKKQSESEHHKNRCKMTLWISTGLVLSVLLLWIMFNISSSGFSDSFQFLAR